MRRQGLVVGWKGRRRQGVLGPPQAPDPGAAGGVSCGVLHGQPAERGHPEPHGHLHDRRLPGVRPRVPRRPVYWLCRHNGLRQWRASSPLDAPLRGEWDLVDIPRGQLGPLRRVCVCEEDLAALGQPDPRRFRAAQLHGPLRPCFLCCAKGSGRVCLGCLQQPVDGRQCHVSLDIRIHVYRIHQYAGEQNVSWAAVAVGCCLCSLEYAGVGVCKWEDIPGGGGREDPSTVE
mmetsp:Transcript_39203/g.98159  ORF Transcript_39203/g.98159 Transcript_39203/m.98159 type:complete len:231 (+) Transcript_39203:823-1515(+)